MSLFVNKYKTDYVVKNECDFHYGVVPSARLQLQSTKIILGLSPRTVLYYTFLIANEPSERRRSEGEAAAE